MDEEKFSFDKERAAKVFSRLEEALRKREKLFSWPDIFPEERFKKYFPADSLEFRLLLFFVVNFDHNQQSSTYYRKVAQSLDAGFISSPQQILDFNESKIEELYQLWSLPFSRSKSELRDNIRLLKEKYQGDPLNVIKGARDINEAKEKLRVFRGYGKELSGLLMTFYIKHRVTYFENHHELEIKIDLNKLRVMYDTEVLVPNPEFMTGHIHKDRIIPQTRDFLIQVCKEQGLDSKKVSEAMWPIGERISSRFRNHEGKRSLNYLSNSPVSEFSDHGKYLDIPYGKKTLMKLEKRGLHLKGSYCYFYVLGFDQKSLFD
jgi:endonuclease III